MGAQQKTERWTSEKILSRINSYAPYVGAGIQVSSFSEADNEMVVRMPLTDQNANLVGTQFGGSLYAMVDPHLMLILMLRLGPEYTVWDKAAQIDFLKPGTGEVQAHIRVTPDELGQIRAQTASGAPYLPTWQITIRDEAGEAVARVHKTLWIRRSHPRGDSADRSANS